MTQTIRTKGFDIYVHEDVFDWLEEHTNQEQLQPRFDKIMELLRVGGSTQKTKTTKGNNGNWLRDTLGGNGGNQYYVWWTFKGPSEGPSIQATAERPRPIYVRAIREHDNHDPCHPDATDAKYEKITFEDIGKADAPPSSYLNERQKEFITSHRMSDWIRVLFGNPGTGKTLTLYRSVSRLQKSVLYVTWSRALAEAARKNFSAFPSKGRVEVVYFTQFLERILSPERISTFSLETAVRHFEAQRRQPLGPWENDVAALLLELRAHKFGRMPSARSGNTSRPSINNLEYNRITRQQSLDVRACNIAGDLSVNLNGEELFPDLQGALTALHRLEITEVQERFSKYDAIVVDEVQDLTILEQGVVVALARVLSEQLSGLMPTIWFAGDEGQTVNGSGFGWPATKKLLSELGFSRVHEFRLEEGCRFPQNIADILEALKKSMPIPREDRPRNQPRVTGNTEDPADIWHIALGTSEEAEELIAKILEVCGERVAVVIPRDRQDERDDPVGNLSGVQTPVEVKGLEYEISCVVNVGRELCAVRRASSGHGQASPLEESFRRYRLDRLRVALSRATSALIVLDIDATDDELEESRQLLGVSSRSKEDLLRFLEEPDLEPEERLRRVLGGIAQIYGSTDAVHQVQAWNLVRKSIELLNDRDDDVGEHDDQLGHDTVDNAAKVALWLVAADTLHKDLNRDEIRETIVSALRRASHTAGRGLDGEAFLAFCQWVAGPEVFPVEFLKCIEKFGDVPAWIMSGIDEKKPQLQERITEGAANKERCLLYDSNIESWIRVSGLDKQNKTTLDLQKTVLETLLENGMKEHLRGFRDRTELRDEHDDWVLAGRVEYALDCFAKAAEYYERAEEWVRAQDARERANQGGLALLNALRIPTRKDEWLTGLQRVLDVVRNTPFDGSERTPDDLEVLLRVYDFLGQMPGGGSQNSRPR